MLDVGLGLLEAVFVAVRSCWFWGFLGASGMCVPMSWYSEVGFLCIHHLAVIVDCVWHVCSSW